VVAFLGRGALLWSLLRRLAAAGGWEGQGWPDAGGWVVVAVAGAAAGVGVGSVLRSSRY